jgi:hypothetical protein
MRATRGRARLRTRTLVVLALAALGAAFGALAGHLGAGRHVAFVRAPALRARGAAPSPASRSTSSSAILGPTLVPAVSYGSSRPVRDFASVPARPGRRLPEHEYRRPAPPGQGPDGALQTAFSGQSPGTLATFAGIANVDGFVPPDTVGDVGPSNYVEAVNSRFSIFDRKGHLLVGPKVLGELWANMTTGLCRSRPDDGDPVVVYDPLADRWLISQFAVHDPDNYHECIAVSKTGDPTFKYWAYDFKISSSLFDDYPKIGVWPDAYYASFNDFDDSGFTGITAVAFQRAKMLAGQPASMIRFVTGDTLYSMLPADLDGRFPPPQGAPGLFLQTNDGSSGNDTIWVYGLHADFATPANSTFKKLASLPVADFDTSFCDFGICIPQKAGELVDSLADRPMQRLAYRNLGGSPAKERLVVDQTVKAGGRAAVRWYELRRTGGNWSVGQQSTFAPADQLSRWMGSAAMDGNRDIAIGYSASSSSAFPSIRYAARLAGDPNGTLQAESIMFSGTGSQDGGGGRWGDYSAMSVDPVDDCTFWYVQEYYATTGGADWRTRVGSFRFPSCVGVSGFSPSSGPVGTTVTITGVGFSGAPAVRFNGVAATSVTPVSATQVKAKVPQGATNGRISVSVGSNTGLSAKPFTVTP